MRVSYRGARSRKNSNLGKVNGEALAAVLTETAVSQLWSRTNKGRLMRKKTLPIHGNVCSLTDTPAEESAL